MRKIVHIDMDAFYASVEQRDDPALRGKPVVVAWRGERSVVCAASYEARKYGVRSAMPATRAERLCPHAIFVPPDFNRYRAVSKSVRDIFSEHTDLIEPLSLDEAYLDVSENKQALPSATEVAKQIRHKIRDTLELTASAGIASNKFLAKIASDWNKPDGLFVIRPEQALDFLAPLPVGRLPGVGKVMDQKLAGIGVRTVGQIRSQELAYWTRHFGRFGQRLHELAHGIDEDLVHSERLTQQISCEDTFSNDLLIHEIMPHMHSLIQKAWQQTEQERLHSGRVARTVVLKLKTSDFHILTRSHTAELAPRSVAEITEIVESLIQRIDPTNVTRYRLAGVGLSHFVDQRLLHNQNDLFAS
jgi:DNA polymerase IV